jgi:DNA-nicking Smr family endonuclease
LAIQACAVLAIMVNSEQKKRARRLSDEERRLWAGITRSVVRLWPEVTPAPTGSEIEAEPEPEQPQRARAAAEHSNKMPALAKAPVPFASLTRRERQRRARGAEPIGPRIDLHGKSQAQAHAALSRFLRRAQADGAKTVLVITGKGDRLREGKFGILRRQVPLWLELPELSSLVMGFSEAHAAHGGAGALYVRLRRIERARRRSEA